MIINEGTMAVAMKTIQTVPDRDFIGMALSLSDQQHLIQTKNH
jgi:hypothetical protein